MKILTHALTAVLAAALVLWFVTSRLPAVMEDEAAMDLVHASQAAEKCLEDLSSRLQRQLGAFGEAVAEDRDFAMKLIVEEDTSASEVAGIAGRYMGPMGLDVLEIAASNHVVLSSGHFPARAGEFAAGKSELVDSRPTCLFENIKGEERLTLQAGSAFGFAEQRFYCTGGVIVDEALLQRLTPRAGVRVILRHGDNVTGFDNVETMSAIENHRIIINDTTYLASAIPLPTAGLDEPLELIVLMDEPPGFSVLKLL
jgi:hypothetical protein